MIDERPIRAVAADRAEHEAAYPTGRHALPAWASAVAGALTACVLLLFLGLLGLGIGLSQFNAATAATQGALPSGLGRSIGLWLALSMFLAFLGGGYVAARMADAERQEPAMLRGALAFALTTPLLLWLLLGGLIGAAGVLAGSLAGLHIDPSVQARVNPTAMGDAASHLRDATWGAFIGCLLGLAGSALGGFLASQHSSRRERGGGRPYAAGTPVRWGDAEPRLEADTLTPSGRGRTPRVRSR